MTKHKSKPKAATPLSSPKDCQVPVTQAIGACIVQISRGTRYQAQSHHCDACERRRAPRSRLSSAQQNGSSTRCAAFLPVSSARNSGSILFQSKPTKVVSIASRMAKLRLPLRTGPNRRPDAMQKKRRSGRASTKRLLRTRSRICAVSISADYVHAGKAYFNDGRPHI